MFACSQGLSTSFSISSIKPPSNLPVWGPEHLGAGTLPRTFGALPTTASKKPESLETISRKIVPWMSFSCCSGSGRGWKVEAYEWNSRFCRFLCLFSGAYREKNWGSSGKHWQSYRHPNRDSTRRKLALGEASELWLKLKLSRIKPKHLSYLSRSQAKLKGCDEMVFYIYIYSPSLSIAILKLSGRSCIVEWNDM